jgi:hypothetical protein
MLMVYRLQSARSNQARASPGGIMSEYYSDPYAYLEIKPLWKLADSLTVRQAAALIAGYDPSAVDASGDFFCDRDTGRTDSGGIAWVHAAFAALTNAINGGSLKATVRRTAWERGWDEEPTDGERFAAHVTIRKSDADETSSTAPLEVQERGVIYRVAPDWDLTTVRIDDLRQWLAQRGMRSGFFFPEAADVPDYLDRDNPRYAPKLAAALSAWLAVLDPGKKTPKQALDKWLREHAAEFGLTDDEGNPVAKAVEECARVANWERGGGAPKSSDT